jgi:transposase-like protein
MVPTENPRTRTLPIGRACYRASKHPDKRRRMVRLSDERRRQMILDALKPGARIAKVAEDYGLNRNTVYEHPNRAVRDPEGQWRAAEASFRRKVYEMTR